MNQCQCRSNRRTFIENSIFSTLKGLYATSQNKPEDLAQASVLKQIPAAYKEYESLFREGPENEELPKHQPWDHEIPLVPGKTPMFGPLYQASGKELAAIKEFIDESLAKGSIRPSTSPASSPVLTVPKSNGKLRVCIDFRQLNDITVKDRYPLPLINELQDRFKGMQYFTGLDLQGAYHLVHIKKGEK